MRAYVKLVFILRIYNGDISLFNRNAGIGS